MSVLVDVADALTAELNGHAFSPTFQAERTYADWELPMAEATPDTLRADVVPASDLETELDDRGNVLYIAGSVVIIRKKFPAADIQQVAGHEATRIKKPSVDALVSLVEQVNEWLTMRPLAAMPEASWKETKIQAAVIHAHLRTHHQFTGIIRVNYEVQKAV